MRKRIKKSSKTHEHTHDYWEKLKKSHKIKEAETK